MIERLRAEINKGGRDGWTLLQKGGGSYRNASILSVDETGAVIECQSRIRFIPWTSINEVYR